MKFKSSSKVFNGHKKGEHTILETLSCQVELKDRLIELFIRDLKLLVDY